MDLRTGKVRNRWIVALFTTSALLCLLAEGCSGLASGHFHMFLAFLFLLPVFAFRVLGAADIKILLSLSVLFPLQGMLFIFITSVIIGAFIGIVILVSVFFKTYGSQFHTFHSLTYLFFHFGVFKDIFHNSKESDKLSHSEYHYIHFTIPIFISVLLYEYGGIYELLICNL